MTRRFAKLPVVAPPPPLPPPATRAGCAAIARPCDRTSCRHHLWLDTERAGNPHYGVHPTATITRRAESCALDVAERGEHTTGEVGAMLGVTDDRVMQIQHRALNKQRAAQLVAERLEQLRSDPSMPPGTKLVMVAPWQNHAGRVYISVVVEVDEFAETRRRTGR